MRPIGVNGPVPTLPPKQPRFDALPDDPTKAQEAEYLAAFVAQLPRMSYLRAYMSDAVECATDAMRGDMSIDLMSELRRRRNDLQEVVISKEKEIKALYERRSKLLAEIESIERRALRAHNYANDTAKALETCLRDFVQVTAAAKEVVRDIQQPK